MRSRTRGRATPKITQPRRGPNEIPWLPAYQYRCTNGHEVGADRELCGVCPGCTDGQPCGGELVRYGTGSKGPRPCQ